MAVNQSMDFASSAPMAPVPEGFGVDGVLAGLRVVVSATDVNAVLDGGALIPALLPSPPVPSASEPSVPEPTVPEPTVPEPTVPESTVGAVPSSDDPSGIGEPVG